MNLDKKAIEMLLTLDDRRLALVIKKLMADAGVDTSSVNISEKELSGIRAALSCATGEDLARAAQLIESYKNGQKPI